MAGIDIDWGLAGQQAQTTANIPAQVAAGQEQGYQIGQQQAVRSALSGVNPSDPASVQSALGSLVQAGATDQAKALSDLSFQSAVRRMALPALSSYGSLMGGGQPSGAGQPAAQSSPAGAGAAPDASSPSGAGASPDTPSPHAQLIAKAVSDLRMAGSFADPDQRQASLAKAKSEFLAAGVDEDAINRTVGDGSQDTLNAAADGLGHIATVHPTFGGSPDPNAALPANAPSWVGQYLQQAPQIEAARGVAKAAGIDLPDVGGVARMYAQPTIEKQAALAAAEPLAAATAEGSKKVDLKYAGPIAQAEGIARAETTPPVAGAAPLMNSGGQVIAWHMPDGSLQAIEQDTEARTAGEHAGALPYRQQEAAASSLGGAAGNLIDVPITDPTTGVTRTAKMSALDYINGKRTGALPASVGVSATDQQAVANKGDAEALNQTRAKVADPQNITSVQQRQDAGTKALALLQGIKTNDLTPQAQTLANVLNTMGVKAGAKDANNLALYAQATNNAVLGYTHDFPSRFTDRDMALVHSVTPTLTTPTDAAKFAFATQVAAANREHAYANAVTNYQGVSQRDLDRRWTNGPGAGSLYADPVWQGIQINGRPAVQIQPKPYKDGHTYGILMPGTPQASTFMVR